MADGRGKRIGLVKRIGRPPLEYPVSFSFSRGEKEGYTLIHFAGDRAKNYLIELRGQLETHTSQSSASDIIMMLDETIESFGDTHYFFTFHYKNATVSVKGYKTLNNYLARTKIAGSQDARQDAESKLIEMTGDDLRPHD